MTIHRTSKTKNFSIIDNGFTLDPNLDWDAKGLLTYLLSKKDDWLINKRSLIRAVKGVGEVKMEGILRKLEKAGYLIKWQSRNSKGQIYYEYEILESNSEYEKVLESLKIAKKSDKSFKVTVVRSTAHGNRECAEPEIAQKPLAARKANLSVGGATVGGQSTYGSPASGQPVGGQPPCILNTDLVKTDLVKTNSVKIKENDFFQKSPLSVGDGLEQPSDFADEALEVDTQNTTAVRTIAIELDEPKDLHTSTLAVLEKDDVPPPRENGSQIIKTAADVAIALESLCPALSEKEVAKYAPDEFDMFWELFGEQWKALRPDIPTTKGTKAPAVKAWNGLFKGVGKNAEALAQAIVMGTGLYWEDKARTGSRSALSAAVFLRNGAWKDAIAQAQSSENNPPAQRFAPFLTCFNQFRPMVWPEADESDLSPKATSRLEELVASCENSIERFEKALLWAKRDKHWGLERSLTFEEFLYSGKINEFHKKQLNAEKIGMDKAIAPDRKTIEAAAKKEASRKESLNRLMNNFRDGEISKQELREMLPGYGVEPDSVPEAC